jgi:hypothetical protein
MQSCRLNEGSLDHLPESGPRPRVLTPSPTFAQGRARPPAHVSTRLTYERAGDQHWPRTRIPGVRTLSPAGAVGSIKSPFSNSPGINETGNTSNRRADLFCYWTMLRFNNGPVQRSVRRLATCLMLLQDIFSRRLFNPALLRSRMARFVEVSMGITPRNVRSEGVAPCRCSRLPNT